MASYAAAVSLRRHAQATFLSLLVLLVTWVLVLALDGCGNPDTVDCTPGGWILLGGWMLSLGFCAALALVLMIRLAARHRRSRR